MMIARIATKTQQVEWDSWFFQREVLQKVCNP